MLHYWLTVWIKTFTDSLRFIDRSETGIKFGILVLILTCLFLVWKHGWRGAVREWKQRLKEGALEAVVIAGVAYSIVCLLHLAYAPWHLQQDEIARRVQVAGERNTTAQQFTGCQSDLRTERVRTDLLAGQITTLQTQISGQQTLIAGQQNTSARQQSTFDLCVTTLAQTNMPVPMKVTLLMREVRPFPDAKHTALMLFIPNKTITPTRFFFSCDSRIKHADVMPFAGVPFAGSAKTVGVGAASIFSPQRWQVDMAFPAWAPENPIVVVAGYDDNDLGTCSAS